MMRRAWILSRAFTQTKRRYDEAGLDPVQSHIKVETFIHINYKVNGTNRHTFLLIQYILGVGFISA